MIFFWFDLPLLHVANSSFETSQVRPVICSNIRRVPLSLRLFMKRSLLYVCSLTSQFASPSLMLLSRPLLLVTFLACAAVAGGASVSSLGSTISSSSANGTNRSTLLSTPSTTSLVGFLWYESFCEYQTILLKKLYNRQNNFSAEYPWLCNFRFIEIFKSNNSDNMLLFGSIFPLNGSQPANFRLAEQVSFYSSSVPYVNVRLVIRFDDLVNMPLKLSSQVKPNQLQVSVGHETFLVQLTTDYEYMLPINFRYNDQLNQSIIFPAEVLPYIQNSSYMVACMNVKHDTVICYFEILGQSRLPELCK